MLRAWFPMHWCSQAGLLEMYWLINVLMSLIDHSIYELRLSCSFRRGHLMNELMGPSRKFNLSPCFSLTTLFVFHRFLPISCCLTWLSFDSLRAPKQFRQVNMEGNLRNHSSVYLRFFPTKQQSKQSDVCSLKLPLITKKLLRNF